MSEVCDVEVKIVEGIEASVLLTEPEPQCRRSQNQPMTYWEYKLLVSKGADLPAQLHVGILSSTFQDLCRLRIEQAHRPPFDENGKDVKEDEMEEYVKILETNAFRPQADEKKLKGDEEVNFPKEPIAAKELEAAKNPVVVFTATAAKKTERGNETEAAQEPEASKELSLDGTNMSACSLSSTGKTSFGSLNVRVHGVTNLHTLSQWDELLTYDCDVLPKKDRDYYEECKKDLRIVLLVYRGVRVRNVKGIFYSKTNYNVNFARLKLKGWAHFLIALGSMLQYKLDQKNGYELYVLISEVGLRAIHKETKDMQCLINTTPNSNGTNPVQSSMISITVTDAYLKGFLDAADGRPYQRDRMHGNGGPATDTLRKSWKTKMTFEEQIALMKKPKDPIATVESTGPLTQDGSLDNFFSWMSSTDSQAGTEALVIPKPLGY